MDKDPFYEGKTHESPTRVSVWEKGASIASLTQSNARHRTEVQRLPMGRRLRCAKVHRVSAKTSLFSCSSPRLSPRCRARTRAGTPCQSPAMTNGRCRMHGGASPGAPTGNSHAFKHGRFTAEAIAERREFAALQRVNDPTCGEITTTPNLRSAAGSSCPSDFCQLPGRQ